MQIAPSTIRPTVKISPPSSTRKSATAIAGIATSTRLYRSEEARWRRRRLRRERSARRRPRSVPAAWVDGPPARSVRRRPRSGRDGPSVS